MSLGWDLAVPIFGGVLLGYALDRHFGTGYVFTMGLLVLGVMVGAYNFGRRIRDEIERDRLMTEQAEQEDETRWQDSTGSAPGAS